MCSMQYILLVAIALLSCQHASSGSNFTVIDWESGSSASQVTGSDGITRGRCTYKDKNDKQINITYEAGPGGLTFKMENGSADEAKKAIKDCQDKLVKAHKNIAATIKIDIFAEKVKEKIDEVADKVGSLMRGSGVKDGGDVRLMMLCSIFLFSWMASLMVL